MISVATYERVALEDSDEQWELDRGHLRSKPGMSVEHNYVQRKLSHHLILQLKRHEYSVHCNSGRLRISQDTYFVPDLYVVPRPIVARKLREKPNQLEVYDELMPLVVEVWSDVAGDYDVEEKLHQYQQRGDVEIWRIHPYERTLTSWRRQADGSYTETLYISGAIQPIALPEVSIDLADLFE